MQAYISAILLSIFVTFGTYAQTIDNPTCNRVLEDKEGRWKISKEWTAGMKEYVEYLSLIRTDPSKADPLKLKQVTIEFKRLTPLVRPLLLEEANAQAEKIEKELTDLVEKAPEQIKIHSDHWQAMSDNLQNNIKRAKENIFSAIQSLDKFLLSIDQVHQVTDDPVILNSLLVPQPLKSALSAEELAKQWSQATDPIVNADPKTSRFLVMGLVLDPIAKIYKDIAIGSAAQLGVAISNEYWDDFLKHPEKLAEKSVHSLSYIGPNVRGTYADVGFILDVSQENILSTYFEDSGQPVYANLPHPSSALTDRSILGPDELLHYTRLYNEVNAVGTHPVTGSKIRAVGVFIKANELGKLKITQEEFNWWENFCVKRGWPAPVIIQEEHYLVKEEAHRQIRFWNLATDIVKSAEPKPTANLESWSTLIIQKMTLHGDQSERTLELIHKSIQVVPTNTTGQFKLQTNLSPPNALRWPHDKMINFKDYMESKK